MNGINDDDRLNDLTVVRLPYRLVQQPINIFFPQAIAVLVSLGHIVPFEDRPMMDAAMMIEMVHRFEDQSKSIL